MFLVRVLSGFQIGLGAAVYCEAIPHKMSFHASRMYNLWSSSTCVSTWESHFADNCRKSHAKSLRPATALCHTHGLPSWNWSDDCLAFRNDSSSSLNITYTAHIWRIAAYLHHLLFGCSAQLIRVHSGFSGEVVGREVHGLWRNTDNAKFMDYWVTITK